MIAPSDSGSYEALAEHLLISFRENALSEEVVGELALADGVLIRPLRECANEHLSADFLRRCLTSSNQPRATLAIRLAAEYPDAPGLYGPMRELFAVPSPGSYWPRQQKTYLTATLPYLHGFEADDEIESLILSHLEENRREVCETSLHYYGGESGWADAYAKALRDPSRRCKRFYYLWFAKSLIEDGYFDDQTRQQIGSSTRDYARRTASDLTPLLDDLTQDVIKVCRTEESA